MTCEGRKYRLIPNEEFYHGWGKKVALTPVGSDAGVDVFKADVQVFLPDGKPAANVWVWVENLRRSGLGGGGGGDWSWLRTLTDKDGKASFRMMPTSAMQLGQRNSIEGMEIGAEPADAKAPGQAGLMANFAEWTPGEKMELRFKTGKPRQLVVMDRAGKKVGDEALAGVKVFRARPASRGRAWDQVAWTPGKAFGFLDGSYKMQMMGVERLFQIHSETPAGDIQVSMKSPNQYEGTVLTLDGKPAVGVLVGLMDGSQYSIDEILPEGWEALEGAKGKTDLVFPMVLKQQSTRNLKLLGLSWTDANGAFWIGTEAPGVPVVLGRNLLPHVGDTDNWMEKNKTLYVIPSGKVTLALNVPRNNESGTTVRMRLQCDMGTVEGRALNAIKINDMGIPYYIVGDPKKQVTFPVPAGQAVKLVLYREKEEQMIPVKVGVGEAISLGTVQWAGAKLPAPEGEAVGIADLEGTPIPKLKLTVESERTQAKTQGTTNERGMLVVPVKDLAADDTLYVKFTGENGLVLKGKIKQPSMQMRRGGMGDSRLMAVLPIKLKTVHLPEVVMTDSAGKVLAGMAFEVEGLLGTKRMTTDGAGKLPIEAMNALYPFKITFTGPDRKRYAWELMHAEDRQLPIASVGVEQAVIQGRVLLPDGKPAAGCLVGGAFVMPGMPEGPGVVGETSCGVYTDEDGKFSLSPTWSRQLMPLTAKPKDWLVSVKAPEGKGLANTGAKWTAGDNALTLTLEKTRAVEVTFTPGEKPELGIELGIGIPALVRNDKRANLQIFVGMLEPGKQMMNLAPGSYSVWTRMSSGKGVTLKEGETKLAFTTAKTRSYKITITDKETRKPIPNAYVMRAGMAEILPSSHVEAWEKAEKGIGEEKENKPLRLGPSGAAGVCTLEVDAGIEAAMYGHLGYVVYAEGYVPVRLDGILTRAKANFEGVTEIPVALEPGAQVRIVPDKPAANRFSPYQQVRTLYFARLMPEEAAEKGGERRALEAKPVVSYAMPVEGKVVIVPRGKPLWCVAKDRERHDGREGTISMETADMLWLSAPIVTPKAWEPVVDVPLKMVNTVVVTVVVEGPKGRMKDVIVYAAIDGAGVRAVVGMPDGAGKARFVLPVGIPLKFWVSRLDQSKTLKEPGWVVTLSDKPESTEPVVLKVPAGADF